MIKNDIYDLYQTMERENILLSFKGVVTSDLLTSVLSIMESKMDYMDESPKTKKKVFNVLVECLQNLYHHIDDGAESTDRNIERIEAKSALFMIAKKEDQFVISTGNYIDRESGIELEKRLQAINGMDKDELKQYYQEVLNNGSVSDKGTAGLGMIDIARKSGNKLEYQFLPVNDTSSFFCLNIKID
ncbi:MAG TPA: SiaB family protein kinase [Fluviicola sp.]|nr:SiaB family protein kinase [Fluviicola sp.]